MRCAALLVLVATLPSTFGKNTVPEQIHIAFAGQDADGFPTGMRIAWYTADLPSSASSVKYGTDPSMKSHASSKKAPVRYLTGIPNIPECCGYHHTVEVIGLTPDTKYYYAVGSDQDGWSTQWSFMSPKTAANAINSKIAVSVFGDMGWKDSDVRPMQIAVAGLEKKWSATETRERLESMKNDLDFVWHLGDIAYADDAFAHSLIGFTYEECYNGYMNWFQNMSATMPYMVTNGNHESECHSPYCIVTEAIRSGLGNFTAYNARWHMPSAESTDKPGATHSMWYSFDYGPVHFVAVNTETDWPGAGEENKGDSGIFKAGHFGADGEYLAWLEADLKKASEKRASGNGPKWIVAGGHRPYGAVQKYHVPLFAKYGVDLYVAGHGHSYSRGVPHDGTTYIMVGGAGCDEMPAPKDDECQAKGSPQACDEGYSVPNGTATYKTSRMATGVLKADAKTLNWQLIDSVNGNVLDEVNLNAKTEGATALV